jgi:hypothetical protein
MPKLIEQTVELLSADAYGRRVIMRRHRTAEGKTVWDIESEPVSQRDEGERMRSLTDQNIADMVAALQVIQRV